MLTGNALNPIIKASRIVFQVNHTVSLYIFSQFGSRSSILGESSTPLVRSSERLAAKRRALGAESLETLYFTPMSQQGNKRKGDHKDAFEHKLESSITSIGDLVVDSAKKLTASARRHRTTQAINMAKVGNALPPTSLLHFIVLKKVICKVSPTFQIRGNR